MHHRKQTGRKRLLFMSEAVTLSHVARPAVLAATLDPERYEIVFACDHRYVHFLGDCPYQVIPVHSLVAGKDFYRLARGQEELFSYNTIRRYIDEDLLLLDRWRPDLIVGDMRVSLTVSARLARIPVVNIQSAHWHPRAHLPIEVPVRINTALPPPLAAILQPAWINVLLSAASVYYNILSLRHGLPPVGANMKDVLSFGDYLVFPDIEEWSMLPVKPANGTYVGPLLWSPPVAPPPWWDRLPTDRPIIYLSLGSSGEVRLLENIISVLIEWPVTVIVSTAGRAQLGNLPPNVFVADYLDGAAAAARAVLFIGNGGSMSMPQALAQGCPVLGIASNSDQVGFMRCVEAAGAGLLLQEKNLTAEIVRRALDTLLTDPAKREAARRLAAGIAAVDTSREFNGLLDRIFSTGGAEPARAGEQSQVASGPPNGAPPPSFANSPRSAEPAESIL